MKCINCGKKWNLRNVNAHFWNDNFCWDCNYKVSKALQLDEAKKMMKKYLTKQWDND